VKFDIGDLHANLLRKPKFGYKWTTLSGTVHGDLSTLSLLPVTWSHLTSKSCTTFKIFIL